MESSKPSNDSSFNSGKSESIRTVWNLIVVERVKKNEKTTCFQVAMSLETDVLQV
jgi:hypothetical protein